MNKEKTISISILICIIFILFFLFSYFFSCICTWNDDNWTGKLPENLNTTSFYYILLENFFKKPCGSVIISTFFDRLFGVFFPLLLNIHPGDFKMNYFCYIEPFFIFSFIFILNSLLIKKINYLYNICFLFTASFLFIIFTQTPHILILYDGLFRMLMPAFLFVYLLYFLIKNINNYSLKDYLPIYILTFFCTTSNEFISICTFLGFLFYSVFSFDIFKSKKKCIYYIPVILITFLGEFILYKLGAFFRKSNGVVFDFQYFIEVLKLIPYYFHTYYVKYVFKEHLIGYLLLILQILILYPKYPKDENVIKTIKLTASFLLSILIFFFLLLGLKNTYYKPGEYWIIHSELHVIYNIILCAFNFVMLHLIIEKRIIHKYSLGIVLLIFSLVFSYINYNFYKNFSDNTLKELCKKIYKSEKIIRLANLKGETAYLDKRMLKDWKFMGFYWKKDGRKENTLYFDSPFKNYINQFEKEEKITNGFIFTDEKTVNKKFKENGGVFTDEELKNINFTRLRDKKFLLNN